MSHGGYVIRSNVVMWPIENYSDSLPIIFVKVHRSGTLLFDDPQMSARLV